MTLKMGQRVLAGIGFKSSSFVEALIGLLCWMLIGLVIFFAAPLRWPSGFRRK
jgi:hypothetical protein